MSIHGPILRQLLTSPTRVAAIDDRRAYRGIDLFVGAMYAASHLAPICRSKTIGLLLPTSGAFPIAALAGWWLGKVVVPLNYLLKREELLYIIEDCECDTIVTAQPMLDHLGAELAEALGGSAGGQRRRVVRMEEIAFTGWPDAGWPHAAADEDLGVLLYTSGTSGKPKGVMLTHGNITANIRQIRDWVTFTSEDVLFGVLPQFHTFGLTVLTLLPLTEGLKVVYTARFVPTKIVKLFREHRPTVFVAVPSMYGALLSAKDAGAEDFASLRYVVSGGEPLPDAIFERVRERFGVTLNEGYGLTETSPVTNWCRPQDWRRHSVGMALPEVVERIVDSASGRVLGMGMDGEVQIKGPNVMRGYYKLAEQTAAVFTRDGFFKTGDMGRFDEEGHLYITGRIKEMLIVAGENVFPREIEEVLNRHPSVGASGVVGKMDPMRGETPMAFVEMKEGETFDEGALKRWCREHLAGFKVPDEIRQLDQLPRNPTGKVMRRELKKLV